MSFKEKIDARRQTATAVFHRFRTAARLDGSLHLFVEGYDDWSFYGRLLGDLSASIPWRMHVCFGKKNMDRVVQLYRSSPFTKHNVLFIRDSDFDRFLGIVPIDDDVFVTCGYSVENYVCNSASLTSFISRVFGVDPYEVDIVAKVDRHFQLVSEVFAWMTEFIGAVLVAIRAGQQLDLDSVDVIATYKAAYEGRPLAPCVPPDQLERCRLDSAHFGAESMLLGRSFTQQEAEWWLRGKYLMLCTCEFLRFQHEELRARHRRKEISQFNRRSSPDFSAPAVFERLSGFTNGTEVLRLALKRRIAPEPSMAPG